MPLPNKPLLSLSLPHPLSLGLLSGKRYKSYFSCFLLPGRHLNITPKLNAIEDWKMLSKTE